VDHCAAPPGEGEKDVLTSSFPGPEVTRPRGVQRGVGDFALAALIVGRVIGDELERQLHAAGYDDLRPSDRVILQHLTEGALTLSVLVSRLGISQQATGKACTRLIDRRYLRREEHPTDGRCRIIALAARGRAAVATDARQREAIEHALRLHVGDAEVDTAHDTLVATLALLGNQTPPRGGRRYQSLADPAATGMDG